MSKNIARLLDQPERLVTKLISTLEDKNGYPSHDVRHLAENIQKVRSKITELGLDPDDTTGQELYHAILVKFEKNSRLFSAYFDSEHLSFDARADKAAQLIRDNTDMPQQWALKSTAVKSILRQQPPKRVMKFLHYRSVESMLKRESICEILLGAQVLESDSWQKAHKRLVSKLGQTGFELRELKLHTLSYRRWSGIYGYHDYLVQNEEAAALALWPSEGSRNTPLLTMILLMLERIGSFQKLKVSQSLAQMSEMVEWWTDMDYLIAELGGERVSLSIKDTAVNSMKAPDYHQRTLEHAIASFWQALVERYENRPQTDGLFDISVSDKLSAARFRVPEPAYEFAEDF